MDKINLIYPELLISISIMFLLMFGVFIKKSTITVYNLSSISLFGALILMLSFPINTNWSLFNDSYQVDYLSSFMKILTLTFGIFVLGISKKYVLSIKILKIEYPILILSSILGMMIMISSNDLIIFYIGLELQSLALYVLASFNRDNLLSSESGVKYFVLSALSS
jgi:NADH-quinone oxidoreductase subunit N